MFVLASNMRFNNLKSSADMYMHDNDGPKSIIFRIAPPWSLCLLNKILWVYTIILGANMRNFVERNRLWLLVIVLVFLVLFHTTSVGRVAQPFSSVETLFTGKIVAFDEEVQAAKAKAEVKGAHGGEIFVAVKRRAYDGPRPFSGNGSTSDVSYKLYPRGAEQLVC